MSGMDDLITWLRDQFNAEERTAQLAMHAQAVPWGDTLDLRPAAPPDVDVNAWVYVVLHVNHWDPARVLAEVEAKRRMLDELWDGVTVWDHDGWAVDFTKLLAQPYAGRPGWREEWRA